MIEAEGAGVGQAGETPPHIGGREAIRIHWSLWRAPLRCFADVASRHGRICTVASPLRPDRRRVVIALGAEANRRILTDPEAFRTTGQGLTGPRGSALRRVRNGLTRSRGEKHRRIRALLMPALQRRAVVAAAPRVEAIVREQLDAWRPRGAIDLGAQMHALALRVSSEVLFAIDERARAAEIGALLGQFMARSFSAGVLMTRPWGRLPVTPYAALHRHAERIEASVGALIAERRRAPGADVLSALVGACDAGVGWLREEDLVGQVTLLFGASYETTAQALTWMVLLLAQHPDVLRALREEAGHGAEESAALSFQALDALPLLDGVVRESLRLFPPVPYTIRTATREESVLGADVRRGDRLLCSHFFTHRDADAFPAPARFDPERWRTASPDPFEYLPFSVAPRMCIGAGFSTAVLKRAIAEVVRRFDFTLRDGTRVDPAVRVTLGLRRPVALQLAPPGAGLRRASLRGGFAELVATV
jgi:cytochrome P450